MNVEIYMCAGCDPCVEACEWMDAHNITYSKNGMVPTMDEYPTIVVDGVEIVGWGKEARKALGGE